MFVSYAKSINKPRRLYVGREKSKEQFTIFGKDTGLVNSSSCPWRELGDIEIWKPAFCHANSKCTRTKLVQPGTSSRVRRDISLASGATLLLASEARWNTPFNVSKFHAFRVTNHILTSCFYSLFLAIFLLSNPF